MTGPIDVATTPPAHVDRVAGFAGTEFARSIVAIFPSVRQAIAALEAAGAGARTAVAEQTVAEIGSSQIVARLLGQLRTDAGVGTTGAGRRTRLRHCGACFFKSEDTDIEAALVKDDVVATGSIVYAARALQTHCPIAGGVHTQMGAVDGLALTFGYVAIALAVSATWALGTQTARLAL